MLPFRISNNIGRDAVLGESDFDSAAAPTVIVSKPSGLKKPLVATLQAIIRDDASFGPEGYAVTNAVVLEVD
jgi:hypothetical protein